MARKQLDRRPDGKVPRHNPSGPDATKPDDAVRQVAERGEARRGLGKPEGKSIGSPLPKPGAEREDDDILDQDRSDRESGRPIQLEEDESSLGGRAG